MKKIITGLLALALVGVTACGNSTPPPPPADGCSHSSSPKPTETPAEKPKGKSYKPEYTTEMKAAFAASKDYYKADGEAQEAGSPKAEAYVKWAEHLYAALMYKNMHENSGFKASSLSKVRELKKLKGGEFKNARGPSDDSRVKAAMKKWQESTN